MGRIQTLWSARSGTQSINKSQKEEKGFCRDRWLSYFIILFTCRTYFFVGTMELASLVFHTKNILFVSMQCTVIHPQSSRGYFYGVSISIFSSHSWNSIVIHVENSRTLFAFYYSTYYNAILYLLFGHALDPSLFLILYELTILVLL